MLTEELLDQLVIDDIEKLGWNLGKIYVNKASSKLRKSD